MNRSSADSLYIFIFYHSDRPSPKFSFDRHYDSLPGIPVYSSSFVHVLTSHGFNSFPSIVVPATPKSPSTSPLLLCLPPVHPVFSCCFHSLFFAHYAWSSLSLIARMLFVIITTFSSKYHDQSFRNTSVSSFPKLPHFCVRFIYFSLFFKTKTICEYSELPMISTVLYFPA